MPQVGPKLTGVEGSQTLGGMPGIFLEDGHGKVQRWLLDCGVGGF